MNQVIYLDNHATTRVDPRVVAAMLPTFDLCYGNAGSVTHSFGAEALELVEGSRMSIAGSIKAVPEEIVFTSGSTESNNLAIFGSCQRRQRSSGHIITLVTEHHAVLDPLKKLEQIGFEVTRLPVFERHDVRVGQVDLNRLAEAIRDDTILVSVMLANNEIGVIQPLAEIARICRSKKALLHADATQAVGRIEVDVEQLDVDLLSFSAHKMYGPKGVGALYVRQQGRRVRLASQIEGGGQERGRRSGTLNVPGIVGLATALQLCVSEMDAERLRILALRERLWTGLRDGLGPLPLNGPGLAEFSNRPTPESPDALLRLAGNLNCQFPGLDGQTIMLETPEIAVSSGSACTSANPEPSHVLAAIGLDEAEVRSSLRFGLGRFTSLGDIEVTIERILASVERIGRLAAGN